jgi:hypothetical protein
MNLFGPPVAFITSLLVLPLDVTMYMIEYGYVLLMIAAVLIVKIVATQRALQK